VSFASGVSLARRAIYSPPESSRRGRVSRRRCDAANRGRSPELGDIPNTVIGRPLLGRAPSLRDDDAGRGTRARLAPGRLAVRDTRSDGAAWPSTRLRKYWVPLPATIPLGPTVSNVLREGSMGTSVLVPRTSTIPPQHRRRGTRRAASLRRGAQRRVGV